MFKMSKKAAIVLAGGKSERFQTNRKTWQDKTLANLYGKPLLVHALNKIGEVAEEVVVCVNDEPRRAKYTQVLTQHGISAKLVVDEKIDNLGGPLVAIFTGLKSVDANYCFILPGDMPFLMPAVIEYMFKKAEKARVVVPMWPNGRLETLTMALKRSSALEIAKTLCHLHRPRSDDLIRGAEKVIFVSSIGEIRRIDPDLKSFVNVNSPNDLINLQPRKVEGKNGEDIQVTRGHVPIRKLHQLRKAAFLRKKAKSSEAAEVFSKCSEELERNETPFWAAISRENEGKSHLDLSKKKNNSIPVATEISKSKSAFMEAASLYELEAAMHQKCGCTFLAERAKSDKYWCVSLVNNLRNDKKLLDYGL